MMTRKVLIAIIIIAVFLSGITLIKRIQIERNNKGVEMVIDYPSFSSLLKDREKEIFISLKEQGISGVAINQHTLGDYINKQELYFIKANEIKRTGILNGFINPLFKNFPIETDSAFIVVDEESLVENLSYVLPKWEKEYGVIYKEMDNSLIIFFPEWKSKFVNLEIGFDKRIINIIKEAGLKVVPRYANNEKDGFPFLNELSADLIIFSGSQIRGYDDKLKETAELMFKKGIRFGMIEPFIAYQKGADTLATLLNYNVLRVHSVQQGELNNYSVSRLVDRYLRAIRERDVRILYLKAFLNSKDERDIIKFNIDYIKLLKESLINEGYEPGNAYPFSHLDNSYILLFISSIGIIAAAIILLEYLLGFSLKNWSYLLLITGLVIELLILIIGKEFITRQLLALLASIVFPGIAVISQLLMDRKSFWMLKLLRVFAISTIGAVFLVSSLSHISFILNIEQFRGVKLAFILPLIIITYYYWRFNISVKDNFAGKIIKYLDLNIKVKHLVFVLILVVFAVFYIGRTGNFPLLPVPAWEIYLRDFLEKILFIRPRFKEFLFGHPFLVIALGLKDNIKSVLVYYPILVLASIGQITVLNTFSHIHTPVLVSVIRVFNGFLLGIIIGMVLLYGTKIILSLLSRKSVE